MHARTVRAGACVRARMRLLAGGGGDAAGGVFLIFQCNLPALPSMAKCG